MIQFLFLCNYKTSFCYCRFNLLARLNKILNNYRAFTLTKSYWHLLIIKIFKAFFHICNIKSPDKVTLVFQYSAYFIKNFFRVREIVNNKV